VRAAASRPIDWDFLLRVAARQRVEGLVHDGLARAGVEAPPPVAARLAASAGAIARENLAFAAESHRLRRAFDAGSVDVLFVKGTTLNMLAYGTLAMKKAVDIDLAVDAADYRRAIATMEAAGYECLEPAPGASAGEILAWAERNKHSAWRRRGILVELHSSLVDSPGLLAGVSLRSPRQEVALPGGISLPTLAPEALFAYLCVHGATHAWSRLKWIADVNALLAQAGEAAIERLHRRAVALGAGRASGQALLLCNALFARALPAGLEAELRADRGTAYIARVARDSLVRGGADAELDGQILGTAAIHLSHLRLMPGWRFKAAEIGRKLRSMGGAPLLALPRWLLRRARAARGA